MTAPIRAASRLNRQRPPVLRLLQRRERRHAPLHLQATDCQQALPLFRSVSPILANQHRDCRSTENVIGNLKGKCKLACMDIRMHRKRAIVRSQTVHGTVISAVVRNGRLTPSSTVPLPQPCSLIINARREAAPDKGSSGVKDRAESKVNRPLASTVPWVG